MGGLVEGCVGRWVGLPMTLATHMRHDEDLPGTLRLKYDEVKKNATPVIIYIFKKVKTY